MVSSISASSYLPSMFGNIANSFNERQKKDSQQIGTNNNSNFESIQKAISTPLASYNQMGTSDESIFYSTTQTNSEVAIYWSVPSCMGSQLTPALGSSSVANIERNPEGYKELLGMISERQNDVRTEYDLNNITQREFYFKTTGDKAVEMTDYFYEGFSDRGKDLIKEFFPFIADNYSW